MKFNNTNISIGKNVKIGDNTTIYDNVTIGDNTIICNDCILGEPMNSYYHNNNYDNPELIIGDNCLVRSHCIFYAGSFLGNNLQTGHRVTIREHTKEGDNCSIGSYCDIQGECTIGNYVRMHSYVNIGQGAEIEDFVFISPYTVLTNDPTPPSEVIAADKIGKYYQLPTSSTIV